MCTAGSFTVLGPLLSFHALKAYIVLETFLRLVTIYPALQALQAVGGESCSDRTTFRESGRVLLMREE